MSAAARVAATAALVACCACAPAPDEACARELFAVAALDDPPLPRLVRLFGEPQGGEFDAALYDGLTRLDAGRDLRVVAVEPLDEVGVTVVDLEAELPGGGAARYSVQVARADNGDRVVRSFSGPAVEWPLRRAPRGGGLSSSPEPDSGRTR